jgi:hypothetical protein
MPSTLGEYNGLLVAWSSSVSLSFLLSNPPHDFVRSFAAGCTSSSSSEDSEDELEFWVVSDSEDSADSSAGTGATFTALPELDDSPFFANDLSKDP